MFLLSCHRVSKTGEELNLPKCETGRGLNFASVNGLVNDKFDFGESQMNLGSFEPSRSDRKVSKYFGSRKESGCFLSVNKDDQRGENVKRVRNSGVTFFSVKTLARNFFT